MPDSPSNPGSGRPARPAIPPFRGPAGGAARPAAPGAAGASGSPAPRGPLTPRDRAVVPPGGLPPRPAVSPAVPPGGLQKTPARPGTPARPAYAPLPSRPVSGSAPTIPAVTPSVAQPAALAAPAAEVAASQTPAVDPLAGLVVLDAGSPSAATPPSGASAVAGQVSTATDWLSPEGALRGDFGDLVDEIPSRRKPEAPVFPTPPAPWPAMTTAPASLPAVDAGVDAGTDDFDAGFEELVAGTSEGSTVRDAERSHEEDASSEGSWPTDTSARATPAEATTVPGMLDVSAAEGEVWADAYGAEADAIHGEVVADGDATDELTIERSGVDSAAASLDAGLSARGSDWWEAETGAAAPAAATEVEASSYLAAEWPDIPHVPDPSTLPTPVVSPTIAPAWSAGRVHDVPADPLLESARRDDDAFSWPAADAEAGTDRPATEQSPSGVADEWAFEPAAPTGSANPAPTMSSLSAAEALEQIAAQLRAGTLRADGYSPALGEAAALSAVLAALLGVDARWDVQR